ncbi:hypothetical protein HCEG_04025 [Histoplasma capsulatum var. duboisii H88]|uniref:Uncharacterized protein n=1 Tax=Ajellomyces capsulatus (strain H88) TaxID=544711 RepID=F0UET0_AJEC8|nr:hypothetical protein HCEG_04025 [Histoplasma capsulatum var. duboisii H88]QSS55580.1 hypothetical protein I7I53_03498 [Histoplasma capsulatum var. duboisii H88]
MFSPSISVCSADLNIEFLQVKGKGHPMLSPAHPVSLSSGPVLETVSLLSRSLWVYVRRHRRMSFPDLSPSSPLVEGFPESTSTRGIVSGCC